MNPKISVVTTAPNSAWPVYFEKFLTSFTQNWPAEIALMVMLDDDRLMDTLTKYMRKSDAVVINDNEEHKKFLSRHKDHPTDYRLQPCRFSHKVWALKCSVDFLRTQPKESYRYLVWLDADVMTMRKVTFEDLAPCLPKEGDAVAYLGRKDWPHSECGWIAFDLHNGGAEIVDDIYNCYVTDAIKAFPQQHDSWVFDRQVLDLKRKATNLTEGKPGIEIWPHSPMAAWSRHYKGNQKSELVAPPGQQAAQHPVKTNIKIQTKNSIPHEQIRLQILENQTQITNWISPCAMTDEELVIVSAGPMLVAEDLRAEKGKKIVAVKHALEPLKAAGIKPWACVLLDPRPHLYKFVENPDTSILWFVASQVDPKVVRKLLEAGCTVWGYHAAVGAEEGPLTDRQFGAVVSGGSATATRCLFMFDKLGFRKFSLYGYDLCLPDKPDMHAKDDLNQPAFFEYAIQAGGPAYMAKRGFWTRAELIAQFEEINQIIAMKTDWQIKAYGIGMVPFVFKAKETNDLRMKEKMYKLSGGKELPSYQAMLNPNKNKKRLSLKWPSKNNSSKA